MPRILSLIVAFLALSLTACQGGCESGEGFMKLRSPVSFGADPVMVDGPKRMVVMERRAYDLGVIDSGASARCVETERVGPSGYRRVSVAP